MASDINSINTETFISLDSGFSSTNSTPSIEDRTASAALPVIKADIALSTQPQSLTQKKLDWLKTSPHPSFESLKSLPSITSIESDHNEDEDELNDINMTFFNAEEPIYSVANAEDDDANPEPEVSKNTSQHRAPLNPRPEPSDYFNIDLIKTPEQVYKPSPPPIPTRPSLEKIERIYETPSVQIDQTNSAVYPDGTAVFSFSTANESKK